MAGPHLFRVYGPDRHVPSRRLGLSRRGPDRLAHLLVMDTSTSRGTDAEGPGLDLIDQVLTLSQLCAHLQVSAQTIYDLRSQGRGPRGFRVGRELRFRVSEIEAWLARMESDDGRRHAEGGR